jgi:hypothetical protein
VICLKTAVASWQVRWLPALCRRAGSCGAAVGGGEGIVFGNPYNTELAQEVHAPKVLSESYDLEFASAGPDKI